MKGSGDSHGKAKVAKKVSFMQEYDQPELQTKSS